MDEDTERIIRLHREKYGPPSSGGYLPPSMRKGSDKAAFFWIAYFAIFAALALYFGSKTGG